MRFKYHKVHMFQLFIDSKSELSGRSRWRSARLSQSGLPGKLQG